MCGKSFPPHMVDIVNRVAANGKSFFTRSKIFLDSKKLGVGLTEEEAERRNMLGRMIALMKL